MYTWSRKVHLLAAERLCTVDVMVTWWTWITTVVIIAGEFGIHAGAAIFPASSTIATAFQPQHWRHVGEGCCNNQGDPKIQFHLCCEPQHSVRPHTLRTASSCGFVDWADRREEGVLKATDSWGVERPLYFFDRERCTHLSSNCAGLYNGSRVSAHDGNWGAWVELYSHILARG